MDLYFECNSGISGDMSVAALLDLGADRELLDKALLSMKLDNEFKYNVTKQMVNAIAATDFEVILPHHTHHHHEHRNLDDVNKIIDRAEITLNAKELAKKIFKIVAEAESKVHNKGISQIHFHEIGAIDSIVDIISFAVLYDNLNPNKVYFSTLSEGQGSVMCQHGELSVPVPAVCEIVSRYQIPIRITDNQGEMITPTGAAIVAALFNEEKLPNEFIIDTVLACIVALHLGSLAAVFEGAVSGAIALNKIFEFAALMQVIHLPIGLIEGIFSVVMFLLCLCVDFKKEAKLNAR